MSLRTALPLVCLDERELAQIHGAGAELSLNLSGHPELTGSSLTGSAGLTWQGDRGSSLTGSVALDGQGWGAGLAYGYKPNPNVSLEGSFRTDGQNVAWNIQGRIRFLHA